jgi:hypothetical protein
VSACCRASSGLLYRQPLLVQLATRMQFLSDFDDLLAASGKASDPKSLQSDPLFSLENRRSLLALAFLIASSHSLRDVVVANEQCHLGYETKTGPVFVPFMHMLEQAQDPNCEVRYEDGKFVLFARKHIYPSNKLQIAYPQVSYDELMYDCGLKARPDMDCNDVGIFLEKNSLNAARAVVQQIDLERFAASQYCSGGGPSSGAAHSKQSKQSGKLDKNAVQRLISHLSAPLDDLRSPGIGSLPTSQMFDDIYMFDWQNDWLQSLQLSGPDATSWDSLHLVADAVNHDAGEVSENGLGPAKLWAILRVMYSSAEEDLLKHGFDPSILQKPESLLSPVIERHVILSMLGMLSLNLQKLGGSFQEEIRALKSNDITFFEKQGRTSGINDFTVADIQAARRFLSEVASYYLSMPRNSPLTSSSLQSMFQYSGENDSPALSKENKAALWYRLQKKKAVVNMIIVALRMFEVTYSCR